LRDIGARIRALQDKEREVKARLSGPARKRLGRPPKGESGPAVHRRRSQPGAYVKTSCNLPLWAYQGLLEAEARGVGPNQSAIIAQALLGLFDAHGIGILVPVGPPLPAKPGQPAQRLYMPKKGKGRKL